MKIFDFYSITKDYIYEVRDVIIFKRGDLKQLKQVEYIYQLLRNLRKKIETKRISNIRRQQRYNNIIALINRLGFDFPLFKVFEDDKGK